MFQEIIEKIRKSNEQRIKMACTLTNVMKQTEGASLELRTAVAASLLEMLNSDMMPEDTQLVGMLNEGINQICDEAKEKGIEDLRTVLSKMIDMAREKTNRVMEGENIINNINFN